jgi:hypothetical protein
VKDAPVAIELPPVAAAYHWATPVVQVAPKVTVPVPQIAAPFTVGVAGIGLITAFTSVLFDSHPSVVLQLTKYEVVEEIEGVVNEAPVAIEFPPVAAAYHWATPVVQVAPNVTVPVPQMAAPFTVGTAGIGLIVAFTSVLFDSHPSVVLQLT